MRIAAYAVMVTALATLLPWIVMAPLSFMAFDSGPSAMAYIVVGLFLAYPVWLLAWLWGAWKSVRAGIAPRAIGFSLVGALPALVVLGAIAVGGRH